MASKFRASGLTSTGSIDNKGDLILTGGIYMTNATGDEIIWQSETNLVVSAQNSIQFKLDSDNDTSGAQFMITDHAGNIQHLFYEDGRAVFNNSQNSPGSFSVKGSTDLGLFLADLNNNVAGLGSTSNVIVGRPGIGTDVKVLLSGAAGSVNTGTRGSTLNAGDLVVSGTSHFKNNLILTGNIYIKSEDEDGFNIGAENDFKISANGNVKVLVDSDDDNSNGFFSTEGIAGSNFVSYEHGQNIFNLARQADGDFSVRGSSGYSLLHVDAGENAVAISDGATTPFVRAGVGPDVKTSIFGTAGSKDGSTRGVTLIIGDSVTSGSTHLQNDLFLTGNIYMTNASGDEINWESESDFVLSAQNSITLKVDNDNDSSNSGVEVVNNASNIQHLLYEDGRAIFNYSRNSGGSLSVRGSTDYGLVIADLTNNIAALGSFTNTIATIPGLGNDVKVLLSGSVGSKGTGTRGVALISGDAMISGSLDINSVKITDDGKIGIGTNNPSYKLDVGGNMSVGEFIYHRNNASGQNTYIQFADDAIGISAGGVQLVTIAEDAQDIVKIGDGTDVDFQVRTLNDDNTLYVQGSSDRVGIGTNAPASLLHLKELAPTLSIQRENNSNDSTIAFLGQAGATGALMHLSSSNDLVFKTYDGTSTHEIMRLGGHQSSDIRQVILLSGSEMAASAMQPKESLDINFFVSGAIDSRGTPIRGTSVFGGDLVVSGTIYGGSSNLTLEGDSDVFIKAGDALEVQSSGGTIMHILGTTKTVFNQSRFNALNFQVNTDNQYGTLFIDSGDETVVLGAEGLTQVPDIATELPSYGSDVKLYLSGTAGSKDSSTRGVTLLTGDLVVSGNIYQKNNSVIKDITRGGARLNVANTNEYYLVNGDAAQTTIGAGYSNLYVAPFSGSFNKLTLRSSDNNAFDGIGGLTASLYIAGDNQDGSSITSNAFSKEIIKLNAGNVQKFKNISFDFTGSNFSPTDVYAIGIKPDNNWNTNASCEFNWVSFSSILLE